MKKQIIVCLAIILATSLQAILLGINGLTLISIPMTIYLGLEVIEKITENETEETTNI